MKQFSARAAVDRGSGCSHPGRDRTLEIVADTVQFLGSRDGSAPGGNFNNGGQNQGGQNQGGGLTPASDVPTDTGDFAPAGGGGNAPDDDIPF